MNNDMQCNRIFEKGEKMIETLRALRHITCSIKKTELKTPYVGTPRGAGESSFLRGGGGGGNKQGSLNNRVASFASKEKRKEEEKKT